MKKIFIQTEDNTIEHVVKNMLEREYQFMIITQKNAANISFRKGEWKVEIKGDVIDIDDSPKVVCFNESDPSLAELFIQARIELHNRNRTVTNPSRRVPAFAIYDFLDFRLGLKEVDVSITVHKSGRIKE